jgi:hypothetical protein
MSTELQPKGSPSDGEQNKKPPVNLRAQIREIRRGQDKARDWTFAITVITFAIVTVFCLWKWDMLWASTPSEFGELLGGAASAFALNWLVAGYYLQSSELRINSLTLTHQADQQEEQAAQQRQMAEAGRQQVEALRALKEAFLEQAKASTQLLELSTLQYKAAKLARMNDIRPRFEATQPRPIQGQNNVNLRQSTLTNHGHDALNFTVQLVNGAGSIDESPPVVVKAGRTYGLTLRTHDPVGIRVRLQFSNIDGDELEQEISL